MRTTVIIPSHGRPAKLAACVGALVGQGAGEVLVGLDGPDAESVRAAENAWSGPGLSVLEFPKAGANEVRSELIARATGELIVTLNDDVVPRAGFIDAHRRAHESERAVVAGYSPYLEPGSPTVLDTLVQRTGLVFFWPAMRAAPAGHDHAYRCAATLNLSVLKEDIDAVGGFAPSEGFYGHDDLELAYRLQHELGLPVRFCADAVADHDHRHTARELLRRDAMLGASMWHYAHVNAPFATDLVGHDVVDPDTLAYYARFLQREKRDAAAAGRAFLEIAPLPAEGAPTDPRLLDALARRHTPARRWLWRFGLLAAAERRFDADQALDALLEPELAAV